jgi:hypothetical protein
MLDRVIKFLGGYTREEYNIVLLERDSYKSSTDNFRGQMVQAEKYFDFVNSDKEIFKKLFMQNGGLSYRDDQSVTTPRDESNELQPIRTSHLTGRQLMAEMQKDDKKRAAAMREGKLS